MAEENVAKLLAQRKARKRGLNFVEKESKFKASIKARWRRPRGKHSPMREKHKGRGSCPHPGFGSPAAVRGFVLDGKAPVLVSNLADLEGLDAAKVAVILSGKVGMRKKVELAKVASAAGLSILNMKDAESYAKAVEKKLADRQKKSQARSKAVGARKARVDKKSDAKNTEESKKSESKKVEDVKESKVADESKASKRPAKEEVSMDSLVEKPKTDKKE